MFNFVKFKSGIVMKRRDFISKLSGAALALGSASTLLSACGKGGKFKLGVCDWSLRLSGSPKSFEVAKSLGLDGVQISMPFNPKLPVFASPEKISEFKSAMKSTGLECASTSPMLNSHPFISTEGSVEYCIGSIEAAHALGAKDILWPFSGKASLLGSDKRINGELFKPLVERLKLVAPVAEKFGVTIGMENSLNAEDDIRIIEAVGSPAVRVYFDIFNFQYYGFETVPEMKKLKGYISQIHLKDKGHKLDSNSGCPRDMQACFDAILEIGYDGWLVFELHGHNPKKDGSIEDVIKYNADFVKKSTLFA